VDKVTTYEMGKVRYRGVYLDGMYTRTMALAIKREAEDIMEFFTLTDAALKKSMEKTKLIKTKQTQ